MKTIKLLKLLVAVVLLTITATSCVQGDAYSIPAEADASFNPAEGIIDSIASGEYLEISLSDLKNLMVSGEANQLNADRNQYVKGYVISSDETGNFYQEFYMQDSPSDPTAGIKVVLNVRDNYITYNIGREVYIKTNDLYIGETNNGDGVVALGGQIDETEIDAMTENQVEMHIFRTNIVETIIPQELQLPQINASHIGTFVTALDVEFPESLEGKPYFDPTDQYDSQRTMQSCGGFDYTNFILETSGFASFESTILPSANGNISGVISKSYNGSTLVMAINTPNDVTMTNTRCSLLNIDDFTILKEENFDSSTNYEDLNTTDWTNFAEEGARVWRERVYQSNGYAEFSAYNSGDDSNIAWLISPAIDMDATANEFLSFKTAQHHLDSADNTLEILVSTDFDGTDIANATWETVSANTASMSSSWYAFTDSGLVDLSAYAGNLYVAFKYTGSGTDSQLDGAYMLDDFLVLAN